MLDVSSAHIQQCETSYEERIAAKEREKAYIASQLISATKERETLEDQLAGLRQDFTQANSRIYMLERAADDRRDVEESFITRANAIVPGQIINTPATVLDIV